MFQNVTVPVCSLQHIFLILQPTDKWIKLKEAGFLEGEFMYLLDIRLS